MADINLSNAVRSNLLSLQNTANLLEKTQNRLATGLKVNSALDDPSSFFTASSLNSRAGDLSRLMDAASNGIQTIQQTDNALSAITKTVEGLQANINSARQDQSFKGNSFTLDPARAGNLSFLGGNVGTTSVDVSLGSVATPTTLAGTGSGFGTDFAGGNITINGTNVTVRGDAQGSAQTGTVQVVGAGGTDLSAGATSVRGAGNAADGAVITISDGTNTVTATIGDGTGGTVDDVTALTTALTGSGFTATGTAAGLSVTSANGLVFTVDISAGAPGTALAGLIGIADEDASFDATATTLKADIDAAGITGLTSTVNGANVDLSLASGADIAIAGDATLRTAIGYGTAVASTNGTLANLQTIDELVDSINNDTNLTAHVRASNDNGRLRIENLSLADLTLTGTGTNGIDGSIGTTTIGGNAVRQDLSNQFNILRAEINKLADDAGFNGVNLLRGDILKLNFNESGTSNIEIQAKDASGATRPINATTLEIGAASYEEYGTNASLDTRYEALSTALSTLRSQASQFGSSLSIVQNREDFTKETINTLETGAANLTLADTNLEGANLLALQTRQQLSSTALSLASQADQNVLRLFS